MAKKYFNETIGKEFQNKCGIYIIYVSTHTYIGSAKNIYNRMQEHRKCLRKNRNENQKFLNAYNKYGESETCWDILEECSVNDLLIREEWWISHLNSDLNINKYPTKIPTNCNFNDKNGNSKPVYQYDLDGNFINEYPSVQEAVRQNLNFDHRNIACAASKPNSYNKSAHGFQWSYQKFDKITKYENNSKYAKIVSVYIFDIITGNELKFNSIADVARFISPQEKNFDSLCATISCSTKEPCLIKTRYLARNENQEYQIPKRTNGVYDSINNVIYKTIKEASIALNLTKSKIKSKCKDPLDTSLQTIGFRARVKLRESGKLQTDNAEDNPNPSAIEI